MSDKLLEKLTQTWIANKCGDLKCEQTRFDAACAVIQGQQGHAHSEAAKQALADLKVE